MKISLHYSYSILVYSLLLFADEIFSFYLLISGKYYEHGMKQTEVIIVFLLALSVFGVDVITNKVKINTWRILFFWFLLLIFFFSTSLFYYDIPEYYYTCLYLFLSLGFASSFLGSKLGVSLNVQRLDKFLPYLLIPLSLFLGVFGLQYSNSNNSIIFLSEDTAALTYQSFSYYMAFFYSLFAYFLFISPQRNNRKVLNILMLPLMVFSAIMSLIGGGRGAFIYLIVITFLLLIYLFKVNKHRLFLIVIVFLIGIFFIFLSNYYGVWTSAGFERISSTLTVDDNRDITQTLAMSSFLSSPFIGHGLGSIFWTVGIYSHNVFIDLLAETGSVGTLLFILLLIYAFYVLYKKSFIDKSFILIMIFFIEAIIQLQFSGYWINSAKLLFVFSFVYSLRSQNNSR